MNLDLAMQYFQQESAELLEQMEGILLNAEVDTTSAEELGALFRCMHTIKGSAGLFGLDSLVDFTHQVENLLDLLREGQLQLDAMLSGLLLRCHDHVKAQLLALEAKQPLPDGEGEQILQEMAVLLHDCDKLPQAEPEPHVALACQADSAWLLSLRFGPEVLRNGMDPSSFVAYLTSLGQIQHIASYCHQLPTDDGFDPERNYLRVELQFFGPVDAGQLDNMFAFAAQDSQFIISPLAEAQQHLRQALQLGDAEENAAIAAIWQEWGFSLPASATPSSARPLTAEREADISTTETIDNRQASKTESRFIKIEASKLDSLINLVGELVIAGAAANLLARHHGAMPLTESTAVIGGLIEQIRSETLSMRMVQIGDIFSRFPRIVRDTGRELNKSIRLVISGAETELDKSMVEKLADPLMHLVRNAIDHGIEASATREQAGKDKEGHVWLNAYHEAGSIVIEVADDGRGLSKEHILNKAVERGLIGSDALLAEQDIYRLVFEPGFSTASHVTNLSGRGVGLDVVKRNIEQLHGSIEIDSEPGLGCIFRLRLPLTLAIIDGFLVEVGQTHFVIPLACVVECMELPAAQQQAEHHDYMNLRGDILPLLFLRRFFELPGNTGRRQSVVVVQLGEHKAGLVVDALQGEFQTVIKPLGKLFRHLKAISGSTILGNGEVALILDAVSLIQYASQQASEQYSLQNELTQCMPSPLPSLPNRFSAGKYP